MNEIGLVKVRRALLSVTDKKDLVPFAQKLRERGVELVSTGGTAKVLREAGLLVRDVSELTGFPEMMEGRVKTLHPMVHGALLFKRGDSLHEGQAASHGILAIDMLVVNLYQFEKTVAKEGCTREEAVENIDIGGPAMIRAAAKNHESVAVVTSPAQYQMVLDNMAINAGCTTLQTRKDLAFEAFAHTAAYDCAIANYLGEGRFFGITGRKIVDIPKGENGHQSPAALYKNPVNTYPWALDRFHQIEGSPMGEVNWTDVDRMLTTLAHVSEGYRLNFGSVPFVALGVKHGNCCGAGVSVTGNPLLAAKRMVAGSTLAIFGDWVMCNFCITAEIAEAMAKEGMSEGKLQKFDGVVANGFDNDALEFFRRKGDRCRCLVANRPLNQIFFDEAKFVRPTQGGDFIIQPNYGFVPNFFNGSVTVYGNLERSQVWDLVLADAICRTSNSNTITMVNDSMLIGNGVGQRSRVDAANLCVRLAHDAGHGGKIKGGAAASDSFFPFPDAPATLIGAGVKVIFSTSGSKIGDEAVAQLCANTGTVLVQLPDSQARGFCRH